MVTIVNPTPRPTITLNTGNNEVLYGQHGALSEQDELSKNALMAETMMQINQESQDYQQELWQQRDADLELPPDDLPRDYPYEEQPQDQEPDGEYDEYPQEEEQAQAKPRRPRKKAAKKVEGSLGYNLRQKNKETDYYEKQLQVKEAIYQETLQREREDKERMQRSYELALEKNRVNDDIAKVSGVLMSAKEDQRYDTEIEANLLLQKLVNQQSHLEREEQDLRISESVVDPEEEQLDQLAAEELYKLSDARDLRSPVYGEFLEKYPICNPYSSDYDRDLAEEIWQIRKDHNRQIKIDGMSSYIGTEEYYEEVQDLIEARFNKSRRKAAPRTRQQPQYQGDHDMNYAQNGTGHTISIGDNDQYSADYAPNYDPSFRKSGDTRDPESGGASGYRQPQQSRREPEPYYRPQQQGYAQQGYGQTSNEPYQQRQAPVAPVSRDGYTQTRYAQQLPELDHVEMNMARAMQGMRFPNGKAMNENDRIMEYRKMKGDRLNGQNRR
jgi:hypothetical protein